MDFKINLFLPFFCFFFFIGCSFTPNELKIAEQIIDSKPDSALRILQNIESENIKLDSNRALYGLIMFQALDNCDKPLRPDSILNFSIEYYQRKNDQTHLAKCHFYKARKYKYAQRYDEATLYYFKALDYYIEKKDYALLGKIYGDIGYICSFQLKSKEVRENL
jgi:tetratricopeptide (TPR) repeat protein